MMPIFDLGWVGLEKVRKMSGKGLQSLEIYFQNCIGTLIY